MTKPIRIICIAMLMFAFSITHAQDDAITYAPHPCGIALPPNIDFDCGTLTVPEDYDAPNGRSIALEVAILRTDDPAPDPLIYLEGGPGGSTLNSLSRTYDTFFQPMLEATGRDIILFDQRGVGKSEPALECPAYQQLALDLLDGEHEGETYDEIERTEALLQSVQQCAETLSADVDLNQYTSANSARDVQALRQALGYEQVNLWGISYGTRLALTVMRDDPTGIRSVILDSVLPPDVELFIEAPANRADAFDRLFAACADDAACAEAFPQLEQTFYETLAALEDEPLRVEVRNPFNGKRYPQTIIDGDAFQMTIFRMMYGRWGLARVPQLITDVSNGDTNSLEWSYGAIIIQNQDFSAGMSNAVSCYDDMGVTATGAIDAAYAAFPRLQTSPAHTERYRRGLCAAFIDVPTPTLETEPVVSDLPTLIINGAFDPITPPAWGERAAQTLSNHHLFTLPATSHGATASNACARQIAAQFVQMPTQAPDAMCSDDLSLEFYIDPAHEPQPASADSVQVP